MRTSQPKVRIILAAAALALAACGAERAARTSYQPPLKVYYASERGINAIPLAPPPEDRSPADRADLEEMLRIQSERTAADCARAAKEAASGYDNFFGDIGPFRTPLDPEASAFLGRVRADVARATYVFKKRYARRRPFLRHEAVKPCLKLEPGYAYPSGHATLAMTYALVLSDLRPDLRGRLIERARSVSLGRVLGGVHHPSDIEAGRELGELLHAEISASPDYRADLRSLAGKAAKAGER